MKANRLFTIALATVCGAAIMSVGSAFAAEGNETYYPVPRIENGEEVPPFEYKLTFSDDKPINNYAISGDNFAFASGTSIFVLYNDTNGERCLAGGKDEPINARIKIEKIEFAEEKLYVEVEDGNTYLYPDLTNPVEYQIIQTDSKYVELSTGEEYRLSNDGLHYFYGDEHENLGTDYSLIKKYGDKAYAVKNNVLYSFNKIEAKDADMSYTDFKEANQIWSGDAVQNLKDKNYQVSWATIKDGRYYTQIDAQKFVDGKFVILPEAEGGKRTRKSNGVNCLILAKSGNATIVANDDGCFITATDNLEPHIYSRPINDWKLNIDEKRLAYAIAECGIYSSPYMCELTKINTLAEGASNHVEVIEKFTLPFIKTTFYKVKYEKGEETVTGYVAANFLTPYQFSAEDNTPKESDTKDFDYGTNVTTVVLVLLIVGLVIIAILYIVMVGFKRDKTGDKRNKKKRRPEPEDYDDDDEE